MSMQDLMSDFVARVNNAYRADLTTIKVLKNNLVLSVCKKMVKLGYFVSFEEGDREIEIVINKTKFNSMKRISKPGLRVYSSTKDKNKVIGGKGFNIFTTSKGIMTHIEARDNKVGGEVLFQVV